MQLIEDRTTQFSREHIEVGAETATIRWRFRYASGPRDYLRGVNLMRVRDGKIVEALGYGKAPAGDGSPLGDVVTSSRRSDMIITCDI